MAYKKNLWDIAFGRNAVSGFPGCMRDAGYVETLDAKTRAYLESLVENVREGKPIPQQDIPALCNIFVVLSKSLYDQNVTQSDVKAQEAMMEYLSIVEDLLDKPIKSFRGDHAFLSNFYECDVEYNGIHYGNAEVAFQAQKCEDKEEMKKFSTMTAKEAKKAGREVKLRKDWEDMKFGIMDDIIRAKFTQNPDLAEKLLETGSSELIEGNTWGDTTWGVDTRSGMGDNALGEILMDLRSELSR